MRHILHARFEEVARLGRLVTLVGRMHIPTSAHHGLLNGEEEAAYHRVVVGHFAVDFRGPVALEFLEVLFEHEPANAVETGDTDLRHGELGLHGGRRNRPRGRERVLLRHCLPPETSARRTSGRPSVPTAGALATRYRPRG